MPCPRRLENLRSVFSIALVFLVGLLCSSVPGFAQKTAKPVLHGSHWVAVTGKPLAATAGAMTFTRGGNAVDAACAMLAATSTMWDTLGWGGETQALIYNPHTGEVKGINALGVAPTGATPEFFKEQGMVYPPEYGPLAAVTPGTPGGLMVMLAEYGRLSLAQVLAPAMEMAEGYPIEKSQADNIERRREILSRWSYSENVFLPHLDEENVDQRAAPVAGEIFMQADLLATLEKLVATEAEALKAGKTRKQAIYAAYDRFYRGDIAEEIVRSSREHGGLFTMDDLERWKVHIEEPVTTAYKGIDVYKLTTWVQGPAMLQALNILEDHRSQRDGLQQRPIYPHRLPGDESCLRRPGLLLRRPVCAAKRTHCGSAFQGVRETAPGADEHRTKRPRCPSGRPLSLPG